MTKQTNNKIRIVNRRTVFHILFTKQLYKTRNGFIDKKIKIKNKNNNKKCTNIYVSMFRKNYSVRMRFNGLLKRIGVIGSDG